MDKVVVYNSRQHRREAEPDADIVTDKERVAALQTTNDAIGELGLRCSRQVPPIPGEYHPVPTSKLTRQIGQTTIF